MSKYRDNTLKYIKFISVNIYFYLCNIEHSHIFSFVSLVFIFLPLSAILVNHKTSTWCDLAPAYLFRCMTLNCFLYSRLQSYSNLTSSIQNYLLFTNVVAGIELKDFTYARLSAKHLIMLWTPLTVVNALQWGHCDVMAIIWIKFVHCNCCRQ